MACRPLDVGLMHGTARSLSPAMLNTDLKKMIGCFTGKLIKCGAVVESMVQLLESIVQLVLTAGTDAWMLHSLICNAYRFACRNVLSRRH